MGRRTPKQPSEQQEQQQQPQASAAVIAASLAQALLAQVGPDEGGDGEARSRAYVVSPEDVAERTEAVDGADMLIVVHEAPYELICGRAAAAAAAGTTDEDGAAAAAAAAAVVVGDCRSRAQQAGALQSGLALVHDGDMVLHVDGSAMRGLAGAVMVVQELLERWGLDPRAVDAKEVAEPVLLESTSAGDDEADAAAAASAAASAAAARRRCVDAVDRDGVCRAWHDFYYELFPATAPPVVDDDDVSAWLPAALEAAAAAMAKEAKEGEDAAAAAAARAKQKVEPRSKNVQPVRSAWGRSGAAVAAAAEEDEEDALPPLFYCLPGGGLNDITVEWWKCIEWAVKTGRTLVSGFENYLAAVPPYTPYFELMALPGLKTMAPAEAARRIRLARRRGGKVTIFPRRLQRDPDPIIVPVSDSEEEAAAIVDGERPWRFNWDELHHLGFEFEKEYGQQVVVFHRKGNMGAQHDDVWMGERSGLLL